MKTWLLKHKMLLYFFAIFGAILVITDMLSWIGFCWECKIVCVNRYCMNLLYAPYWGKQR